MRKTSELGEEKTHPDLCPALSSGVLSCKHKEICEYVPVILFPKEYLVLDVPADNCDLLLSIIRHVHIFLSHSLGIPGMVLVDDVFWSRLPL